MFIKLSELLKESKKATTAKVESLSGTQVSQDDEATVKAVAESVLRREDHKVTLDADIFYHDVSEDSVIVAFGISGNLEQFVSGFKPSGSYLLANRPGLMVFRISISQGQTLRSQLNALQKNLEHEMHVYNQGVESIIAEIHKFANEELSRRRANLASRQRIIDELQELNLKPLPVA